VKAPLCEKPFLEKDEILEFLKNSGVKPPRIYDEGFTHNNCFSGDTRFITNQGIRTLEECEGESVWVLTRSECYTISEWEEAKIKSFGVQPLMLVQLESWQELYVVIKATPDHEWLVLGERGCTSRVYTKDLRVGDYLASSDPKYSFRVKAKPYSIGEDKVFCAQVPHYHTFSLEHYILTGNCGGFCVKQGLAAHKRLLEKRPDVYAYHEEQEKITRNLIGKGHGFIKKQINNKFYYLTMEEYRKYLTEGDEGFLTDDEKLDFGGCGCFNDFDDSEFNGKNSTDSISN
jgi:intein/homing endonuclease